MHEIIYLQKYKTILYNIIYSTISQQILFSFTNINNYYEYF